MRVRGRFQHIEPAAECWCEREKRLLATPRPPAAVLRVETRSTRGEPEPESAERGVGARGERLGAGCAAALRVPTLLNPEPCCGPGCGTSPAAASSAATPAKREWACWAWARWAQPPLRCSRATASRRATLPGTGSGPTRSHEVPSSLSPRLPVLASRESARIGANRRIGADRRGSASHLNSQERKRIHSQERERAGANAPLKSSACELVVVPTRRYRQARARRVRVSLQHAAADALGILPGTDGPGSCGQRPKP